MYGTVAGWAEGHWIYTISYGTNMYLKIIMRKAAEGRGGQNVKQQCKTREVALRFPYTPVALNRL